MDATTHGAALIFETLAASDGEDAPIRVFPDEDMLLRVLRGSVRLAVDGEERRLAIGDEVVILAGAPHRLTAVGGEARLVSGSRPARR